ncbi:MULTISPECIES: ABC transporter ATP-binding protein [Methanobacterium]|uniref:Iron ABC transporter ATP-binding protein n=1 Tax=Methanobacterium bryantii TaxID=2161 RepID=A0A2A2H1U7_METBR|nr:MULTISPECIES: ABC transporter ATP-binding protein [Methanobacterium]OEC84304.1 iron ABC transporter ATP-binding protein [Methanobacterium sp. A39]PAV03263.1 iron ABC transporter ATP-binding protein [Methanobacterium bryantii]
MSKILEIKHAGFSYNQKEDIFNDVNLSLESGDVLCILGPNGTGKSTLIKCMNGLLKLNSGNILINNQNIHSLNKNDLAKIIGYIPQSHNSTFAFSVFDVVLMGRAPHLSLTSVPGDKDYKIAEEALKSLGISHLTDKTYTEISGGERQMVLIARVLAQQPQILLLDEPTSHLDFGNQIRTLDVINKLAENGLSVIMTSHFPDHAFLSSNKVAIMNGGTIMEIGTPESVITEENMRRAYNIDVKIMEVDEHRKACIPMPIK